MTIRQIFEEHPELVDLPVTVYCRDDSRFGQSGWEWLEPQVDIYSAVVVDETKNEKQVLVFAPVGVNETSILKEKS